MDGPYVSKSKQLRNSISPSDEFVLKATIHYSPSNVNLISNVKNQTEDYHLIQHFNYTESNFLIFHIN